MKIVIDIPEKTNAHIRSDYGHGIKGLRTEDRKILCDAIYHGTPYEDRPQWIPCSERLPEKSGRYLVTEKRFAIDDRKHNGRYQTVVEEVTFSNGIWNRANFIEVLAWMPLPTPYREEESNNHDKNIL